MNGKKLFLLSMIILSAWNLYASTLEIHMVTPPKPIKWKSPRSLFLSTLANSWYNDYAPNGHYMVYFVHDNPKVPYGLNEDGKRRVLTGISRTNKMATMMSTLRMKMGFSALYYTFSGTLDASEADIEEINKSRRKDRIISFKFDLTEEQADKMEDFLEKWIRYGSFKDYAGNKNTASGDGSGCADFAMIFMNIASDGILPLESWVRELYVPKSLMRFYDDEDHKKVGIFKLAFTRKKWAIGPEDGVLFTTPDPDLMSAWVIEKTQGQKTFNITYDFLMNKAAEGASHRTADLISSTEFDQPEEDIISEDEIKMMWEKIALHKPLEEVLSEGL